MSEKTTQGNGTAEVRPGDKIRVYQIIEGFLEKSAEKSAGDGKKKKRKVQVFEGTVIARKHGKEIGSTITVRTKIEKVGVEKIFPLFSPLIEKIEIVERKRVRRAKLYYIRGKSDKEIRKKLKSIK